MRPYLVLLLFSFLCAVKDGLCSVYIPVVATPACMFIEYTGFSTFEMCTVDRIISECCTHRILFSSLS
jgi:hypothetical protein